MIEDMREIGKAIEDLRRESKAEHRTLKNIVKLCNGTFDGINKTKKQMKEVRKNIQKLTEIKN